MNVIVLAGGTSTERDISIVSGTGVAKALKAKGHNVFLLDAFFGCGDEEAAEAFKTDQDIDAAAAFMKAASADVSFEKRRRKGFFGKNVTELCMKADKVFIALHGSNGEDGRVQAALDLFGVKYTGCGYISSALAMDKGLTKQLYRRFDVPTPKGGLIRRIHPNHSYQRFGLSLPVVVKPCCGGSSVGVYIVNTDEEYQEALRGAFDLEDSVIVEEYISGREFAVAVVEGEAYPVIEIVTEEGFYDYTNKYNGLTKEICPAEITEEQTKAMQKIALDAAASMHIDSYCRMDMRMTEEGKIYCLEANTIPGMTPTSLLPQEAAVLGISYEELCEKILYL